MKKVAFAAALAACVGASGAAFGADLSLKDAPAYEAFPETIWTGLYVGGHIGGGTSNTDFTDTYEYGGDPIKTTTVKGNSLLGGLQVGYNRQSGNIVFGVEADLGGLNLSESKDARLFNEVLGSNPYNAAQYQLDAKYSIKGGLYGDITGRIGYANNRSLFYAKGGAAFLNVDVSANYVGGNCSTVPEITCWQAPDAPAVASKFNYNSSDTMWGWTLGAGVEYALSSSWSLKAEYQHFDFGSMSFDHNNDVTFYAPKGYASHLKGDADVSPTLDAVSVGLNYRFNGSDGALK